MDRTNFWLLQTPESSSLKALRFSPDTDELYVKFKSGAVYRYEDVTMEEFAELTLAESRGKWFAQNIRDTKDYDQVK